ncbi:NAD(P)H-binding protein [Streptomyces sp. NPDC002896]|uniref:NAD(P)H-binding protein n=1 Tax=Streptomyces sp. NPDC002896 TaxID=3154438 RepID=UPI0033316568
MRALSRSGTTRGLPDGAEAVAGDLNEPGTVKDALDGVRGLFLLPGYGGQHQVLADAHTAGVQHVVLLSSSSIPGGEDSNAVTRYMLEAEAAVRDSGLTWTFLRPVGFMSNTLEWAQQLREGDVVRAPFPRVRVANIDPYDIGRVAARALLPPGHERKAYALTGPESLLPEDRVRVLGEVLGRELRFEGLSDAEAREELSARMPGAYVDAFFRFHVDGTLDESQVLPTVQEITGRAPRTFHQWAEAHADAFRSS